MSVRTIQSEKDPRRDQHSKSTHTQAPPLDEENFPSLPVSTMTCTYSTDPWDSTESDTESEEITGYDELSWIVPTNPAPQVAAVEDTSPPKVFTLYPNLPLEICEMIIEHAMRADGEFDHNIDVQSYISRSRSHSQPIFLPAICFTSEATRAEAAPVYISNTTWKMRGYASNQFLTHFLESIPNGKGFSAVRNLHFTAFHWFPGVENVDNHVNADLELMARCTGLKKICFTFHASMVMSRFINKYYGVHYRLKSVQEIVKHYDFEQIFRCASLREITVDGLQAVMDAVDGYSEQRLQDVVDWIQGEFKSRFEKEVKTTIKWRNYSY
ncbi:hypothetical protein K491DRAFT_722584 [Lophiostoma macrostomum CBS 122681]|uniref:F-box domain-containing protein n=1 Tax=Lophiostoma macrostomum CBS 122681 TaxID=1314788 RepID=A0A6A6SQH9_9PLEO|nr:hypothetical protein K491DRAFT_722584 [Lophiostoma macrostomum CBS 122681]